jgi:anti-sigma factor RsiW
MDKLARLTSEDRDNLTAYLDGELDENNTRRIEAILTSSAVARTDVEILARVYELLDVLPRPKANKEFTERTIATARLEAYRKPLAQQPWFKWSQRGAILASWTAILLVAGALGFSLTNRWIARPDDILLRDLSLIQNLDVYSEVGSVEFLQELSGEKNLLEEMQGKAQP